MSDEPPVGMGDLFDELDELEDLVGSPEAKEQVRETMRVAMQASRGGTFGRVIKGFDRADLSEAMLGSLLFGIPMAVEGGTNEVGAFLATRPLFLLGTAAFAVAVVIGILYVADFQDVRIQNPILGVVPRRLVGVIGVAFLMSFVMMTGWGRVTWQTPWAAVGDIVVAFVPMSIGAALGDILPGS